MALTVPVAEIVKKTKNPLLDKHASWKRVLLGEIATVLNGYAFKSAQFTREKGTPLIRIRDVGKDSTDTNYVGEYDEKYIVEKGDLLIGMDGDFHSGRWTGTKGLLNQRVCKIVLETEVFLLPFLVYLLPGYLKAIHDVTSSVTVKHLSSQSIKDIPLPFPPVNEQKRIVEEIEKQFARLDEAVENLKRVKANLKRYKASVLKAAVEGNLTEDWRKKNLPAPSSKPGKFYAYAILCDNNSIYIGQTDDIERRWKQHLDGEGAEWTNKHKPIKIVHYEEFDSRKEAAEREKWLKTGYGRKWIKREYAAGRTRQAGDVEPADKLLERILAERRKKWEEAELAKMYVKGLPAPKNDLWFVYVILCDDNSFYIGVSNDLKRRWTEHTTGQGAEWTKSHKLIKIIHHEELSSQEDAYKREKELKTGFGRKWLKREFQAGRLRQAGKVPKDDKWKKKYKEPERPEIKNLPDIPATWLWARLDSVAEIKGGITKDSKRKIKNAKELPYLRVANVQRGHLDLDKIKYIKVPEDKLPELLLNKGDILFNEGGDRDKLGRGWVWEGQINKCTYQNHVFRVRLYLMKIDGKLFSWYGNTFGQQYFMAKGKQTTNLASINKTMLSAFPIPLPPFDEQAVLIKEIEKRLSMIDVIEKEVDRNLIRADRLRQSILKKAFSGQLVPENKV